MWLLSLMPLLNTIRWQSSWLLPVPTAIAAGPGERFRSGNFPSSVLHQHRPPTLGQGVIYLEKASLGHQFPLANRHNILRLRMAAPALQMIVLVNAGLRAILCCQAVGKAIQDIAVLVKIPHDYEVLLARRAAPAILPQWCRGKGHRKDGSGYRHTLVCPGCIPPSHLHNVPAQFAVAFAERIRNNRVP